jgi:hypothetical protein
MINQILRWLCFVFNASLIKFSDANFSKAGPDPFQGTVYK